MQVAHGEGQGGNGLDAGIHVDVDAVGGKDAGGNLLEVLALEAGVASQCQSGVVVVCVQIICHALGGLGDHVDVHAVCADAQRSAQACGAKLEVAIEGVVELFLIAGKKLVKLGLEVRLGDIVLPELDRLLGFLIHSTLLIV